jgi:anti-sigma factor RsiW
MSSKPDPIDLMDLSAYVDCELDELRTAAVEKHIGEHPDAEKVIATYRRRDEALRHAFAEYGVGRAGNLQARLRVASLRSRWRAAAAAALVGAIIGAAGWRYATTDQALAAVAREAVTAHSLYAGQSARGALVTEPREQASAKLSALIGAKIEAPDLSGFGFVFVGMREIHADNGPAILLVYRDGAGRDISCYFERLADSRESEFMRITKGRTSVIYRHDEHLGYAVVGALQASQLEEIANAGYAEVSAKPE